MKKNKKSPLKSFLTLAGIVTGVYIGFKIIEDRAQDEYAVTIPPWTEEDIPDQSGKVAIVTGANSGIGLETARALAEKGATVIMACRNMEKGKAAAQQIHNQYPESTLEVMQLDLADLSSVRKFATDFNNHYETLDILCNNAGIMGIPYQQTADDFEMQFGTNHLGHFALTGLLLDKIIKTGKARVVTVSSSAHRMGKIDFNNLNGERSYNKWIAYSQSKLANLLFTYELQQQLEAVGSNVIAVAAHPGWTATNLQHVGPAMSGSKIGTQLVTVANTLLAQEGPMGALPTLFAATAPTVKGGDYFGPDGFQEMKGYPKKVDSIPLSHDRELAEKLWQVSEEMTGVVYTDLKANA